MLQLRKILLCDYVYYVTLIIVLIITLYRVNIDIESKYNINQKEISGILISKYIDGNKLEVTIKAEEKVKGYYYFETKKEKEEISTRLHLGDKIKISGNLEKFENNKTKELFNYQKYMKRQGIIYYMETEEITLLEKNNNILYKLKDIATNRCDNKYLKVFILGDKKTLDASITNNYKDLGISHLFAISGMHITLISNFLLKVLKKISTEKRYFIISIFLIFYLFITGLSPSILRAILFFILFSINKIYYFYVKSTNVFILVLIISLIINPNYIFDVAFLYSFSISFSLIAMSSYINEQTSYIKKLFITSTISFLVSIPISLYYFNQFNILSIIYNLFYVPFISYIVFPLAILTFFIKETEPFLNLFINVLESSSEILTNINFSKLIFCSNNAIFYIIYVILIVIFLASLIKKKYLYTLLLPLLLIVHYYQPIFFDKDYMIMIDVGQGDSILFHSNNKNILIDTGGVTSYQTEEWQKRNKTSSIVLNTTIPLLKKLGIKKLDYLVLTHGDYDHLGEANTLLDNFKVDKVYINEGNINYLEKQIVNNYDNVDILKQDDTLRVGNISFVSLNHNLEDENDSSIVLYAKTKSKTIMLMGDASIKTEKEILSNYNLEKIDILKVGHHGSRTSSSLEFLKEITPDIALISAGRDNKFNHPHMDVVEKVSKLNIKIMNTQDLGCIKIYL